MGKKEIYKSGIDKYSKELSMFKGLSENFQRNALTYKALNRAVEGISNYIEECDKAGEDIAITGIILASGLSKTSYEKARNGDYDHIIAMAITQHNVEVGEDGYGEIDGERIYLNAGFPYSAVIERAEMIHEYQTEKRLADNSRKNVVADIFSLKAKHGWQEEDTRNTNNLTINVASLEEAKKSLKALKGE